VHTLAFQDAVKQDGGHVKLTVRVLLQKLVFDAFGETVSRYSKGYSRQKSHLLIFATEPRRQLFPERRRVRCTDNQRTRCRDREAVFHVVGVDDTGVVVLRKRLTRSELLTFMRVDHRSALAWKRVECPRLGPVVSPAWPRRTVDRPPICQAYVKSPKHEARDAEAICEAVTRPTMRVVPIKRVEPQDLQALH